MARRKETKRAPGRWSEQEIKRLKRIFRNMSNADVARELKRSIGSVTAKAYSLGLRKTKKYLKSIGRG